MPTLKMHDLAGADPALRFSPFCWRARMAIAHKGLECETLPWRFAEKTRIRHSGGETVPVVEDGDRVVRDSWAIFEYLDASHRERPALFPTHADRAYAAFVRDWVDTALHPCAAPLLIPQVFELIDEGDRVYFRESREKRFGMTLESLREARDRFVEPFEKSLAPLRAALSRAPFLGGDDAAAADYIAFGTFQWIRGVSSERLIAEGDPIRAWCERLLDRFEALGRQIPERAAA